MDDLILPDKVLNRQVCTECMNYLSVGPVMVSREGKILCGRCSPDKQSELKVVNHSLYNLVAEKLVFRCVNYYEGCEELLNFNEAVEHEKNCKRDGFKCPFCDYAGNGCQLVHHFDRDHPKYVVKEDDTFTIVVKETFWTNLIFVKKNSIFCLIASMKDTFIEFFNLLISPINLGPKRFKLRFFKSDTNIEFVTGPIQIAHESGNFPSSNSLKNNIECDTNSTQIKNSFLLHESLLLECFPSGWCLCKIKLIDENHDDMEKQLLKMKYLEKIKKNDAKPPNDIVETKVVTEVNEENFDINCVLKMSRSDLRKFANNEKLYLMQNCVNCKKKITHVVYFCPKYHMACKECTESECVKCHIFCIWNIKPKLISLPCEWNSCSDYVHIFNYTAHKRDCVMRRYKCPDVDCAFEGCLVELKQHWHINSIFDDNSFHLSSRNRSMFWHVRNYHEIFYVSIKYNSQCNELHITIRQVDVVLSTCYKFQVNCKSLYTNQNLITISLKDGNDFIKHTVKYNDVCSYQLSCSLK